MFTKETMKTARANVTQINIVGGYCEIKNPNRRAMARKNDSKKFVRTAFVRLFILIGPRRLLGTNHC